MLSSAAGWLAFITYGVTACLLAFRGRATWQKRLFVIAVGSTALWAALYASWNSHWAVPERVVLLARVARDAAWYGVLLSLLRESTGREGLWRNFALVAAAIAGLELVVAAFGLSLDTTVGVRLTLPVAEFAVSLYGLVLIENVMRNAPAQRVWSLKLMATGLSSVYALDVLLRTPELLGRPEMTSMSAVQPLAYVVVLPLFIVTAIRNDSLKLQIHSSRNVVFQSATVLLAGILLQGAAAAAYYVRNYGGGPSVVLLIVFSFTALVGFILAVSSHAIRSRLRTFINENFYSYKYDYRLEWKRFIYTLSLDQKSTGPERVLRTITNLLDSPGGILWVRRHGWKQFLPLAHWSLAETFGPIDADDPLLSYFQPDVDFIEFAGRSTSSAAMDWQQRFPSAWLVIALRYKEDLVAFAILQKPRAAKSLDWEDRNLLKLTALELGAHLVHEHTAQLLSDTQQLAEFNKRVTFAVHDLKNTAGQLSLLAQNAERFGDNADFRTDMVSTIKHAANNLQRLIEKLSLSEASLGKASERSAVRVNLSEVLERLARRPAPVRVVFNGSAAAAPSYIEVADVAALESALHHVLANAIEASPEDGSVKLELIQDEGGTRIQVADKGPGMTREFVNEELFRPLRSTKKNGMGVGAYQAKSIMSDLGGSLEVETQVGIGTTVTLCLPSPNGGRGAR